MPKVKKELGLAQSVIYILIFWSIVAGLFALILHLLQRWDISSFMYNLIK